MNSRMTGLAAALAATLAAGPVAAGDTTEAPAHHAAGSRIEAAVLAQEARLARLAEWVARQQGFEVRLAAEDQADEETEVRLKEAEMRLEEAAREIAELTAQIVGQVAPAVVEGVGQGLKRAMLGVNVKNLGDADDKAEGVLVVGVTPGWPADEAGMRNGDVILSVDGKRLDWAGDSSPMSKLVDRLGDVEAGSAVKIEYRRDGDLQTAEVKTRGLAEHFAWQFDFDQDDGDVVREFHFAPPVPGGPHVERDVRILRNRIIHQWGDMELVDLTPGLGEYFGTDEGVLVVRAPKDETLGLRDGDVILDIGGRKPVDPGHVMRILRSYEPGETLAMTIVRKKKRESVRVEVPAAPAPEMAPPVPAPSALPAPPPPRPDPVTT